MPPSNALVCSSPHIKELVSAEQLARLQGKFFVHPSLTALHEPQSQLRRLLRIRGFDPASVITLVRVSQHSARSAKCCTVLCARIVCSTPLRC